MENSSKNISLIAAHKKLCASAATASIESWFDAASRQTCKSSLLKAAVRLALISQSY
jgi:hypothetical protein